MNYSLPFILLILVLPFEVAFNTRKWENAAHAFKRLTYSEVFALCFSWLLLAPVKWKVVLSFLLDLKVCSLRLFLAPEKGEMLNPPLLETESTSNCLLWLVVMPFEVAFNTGKWENATRAFQHLTNSEVFALFFSWLLLAPEKGKVVCTFLLVLKLCSSRLLSVPEIEFTLKCCSSAALNTRNRETVALVPTQLLFEAAFSARKRRELLFLYVHVASNLWTHPTSEIWRINLRISTN